MWLNVLHAGSLAYVLGAVVLCLRRTSLFSLHPIMMTLAFVLFMVEGVLFLYPRNKLTRDMKKVEKTKFHWIIQSLAMVAVGIGFMSIFLVKISNGKEHFTTWHGLLGLIAVILVFSTAFIGALALYRMKISFLIKPYRIKLLHGYAGIMTLILGFICIGFGYSSTWASEQMNAVVQAGCIIGLLPLSAAFLYIFKHL